ELTDERFDVAVDVLPFLLKVEQHLELLRLRVDRFRRRDALLDARPLAAFVLSFFGVVPETGNGHLALDLVERLARRGNVKDSSGRRSGGTSLRRFWLRCRLSSLLECRMRN